MFESDARERGREREREKIVNRRECDAVNKRML